MTRILRSLTISTQSHQLQSPNTRSRALASSSSQPVETTPPVSPQKPVSPSLNPTEAADLIEQARQSVLEQIKSEAESARELGRQRGLREGRQLGIDEAKNELAKEISQFQAITAQLGEAIATGVHNQEELAISIAFEAICKILGESAAKASMIEALVRQTAKQIVQSEKLLIRLHPADLDLLQQTGAVDMTLKDVGIVSWRADKQITIGGCIVESSLGGLDARLETQLKRLCSTLLEARQHYP